MSALDKVIGYDVVKKELNQIIDMYKHEELYTQMGAKLPKGVLIYGAPGLGKSLLAKSLIEDSHITTFTLKKNKNDAETIKEITDTFALAEKENMAIVFIDDIDKFSSQKGEDCDAEVFVAIQSGMDSVKEKNVLVLATANHYRRLPDSLKRSGRFDRKIEIDSPNNEDAAKIIEHYLKSKRVDPHLNYEDVTKMINYTSCADLETIINESAIYAAYDRKDYIDINDLVKAYLREEDDTPREDFKCSRVEIEKTALHEAGHAVIAETLKEGSVGFISIQAVGNEQMKGFTHLCCEMHRRPEMILIGLGGKSAVELNYEGRCASGCQGDLARVAHMLRDGINNSGTCGLGLLDISMGPEGAMSESYNMRDEAVTQAELERYQFKAHDILIKNKDFLMALYKELADKHNLLYSDIRRIRASVTVTPTVLD